MADIQRRLGARIKALRAKKQWSQEELAARCGFHRSYMGAVERGEKNLTIQTLQILARTLGVTIQELFREVG
jgi:transcriptional regulator with XRE-family HTH domain